jgi:outer membrane lipoprotein-sorting protein
MSRPTRLFLSLPAALAIVFLTSCALTAVKPTPPIPPVIDAAEALAALTDTRTAISDIRGAVTLKTFDENGKPINSVTGYMAFRYPDRVRFTYIGPFGMVLFEALVNETTTILFLPQQLTAYKGKTDTIKNGPFSPELMEIPFRKPAGPIFIIEHDGPESTLYSISKRSDRYDLVEKIIFDRSTMRPILREVYENGLGRYRITYLAYEAAGTISVPTGIAIQDLTSGSRLEITLSDYKVNTGITDEVFDTTVEPPYVEKPLDSFVLPDY